MELLKEVENSFVHIFNWIKIVYEKFTDNLGISEWGILAIIISIIIFIIIPKKKSPRR